MASRGPAVASSPMASLDRALTPSLRPLSFPSLAHSPPFASNPIFKRFSSSLDFAKARLLIQHFEAHSPHLHIACLALQLSDCADRYGSPNERNSICCPSAAASLLGLLHFSVVGFKNRSTFGYIRSSGARTFRRKGRSLVVACHSPGNSRSSDIDGAEDSRTTAANASFTPNSRSSEVNTGPEVGAIRILSEAKVATTQSNAETQAHRILSGTLEDGDGNSKGLNQSINVEDQYNSHRPTPTSQRRWPESPPIEDTLSRRKQNGSTAQRFDAGGQRSGTLISGRPEVGNDQERNGENPRFSSNSSMESVLIVVKEPIYEVLEVNSRGMVITKSVSRRQLLKTGGLRLRDVRSVDPSLWVTNSMPALLIRDQAILLNLGSLRAIATLENVLIFDHKSVGAEAFLELLLPRLNTDTSAGTPTMPFELEVVEAALLSRTQRLERRLMEVEPRVLSLLEVLPNCLTANGLEELRLSKQALVELGSKSGALRQMLLDLLENPQEIRRMTIIGRQCFIRKEDGSIECTAAVDKRLANDEEEEMEMLLENYLQRCESCHGHAQRLLDSAKEMEDSIAVNLSSRRLEVSRLELLLQVGTVCSALGALVAGIFGMNLRSYMEASVIAFWSTTAGIILGGLVLFFIMYNYLKQKKIL